MRRLFLLVIGALVMTAGAAQAQTSNSLGNSLDNSLGATPDTEAAEKSAFFSQLRETGYIFYKPEEIVTKLTAAGFQVVNRANRPNGDVIYTTVIGQQLFAWAFLECLGEECFIFRPIYVMPVSALGLRLSAADANRLNADSAFGYFLVSEQGDIVLRNSLLALPQCGGDCQDQALLQFVASAQTANQIIGEMLNQKTVGIDQSTRSGVRYGQQSSETKTLPTALANAVPGDGLTAHIQSRGFAQSFEQLPLNLDVGVLVYGDDQAVLLDVSETTGWPGLVD